MHTRKANLFFAVILLLFSFLSCGKPDSKLSYSKLSYSKQTEGASYSSFRDIPGVTEDEIKAIEALREQYDHFAYGMISSTESFYDDNGDLKGFTVLFCDWLTGLFGIPFIPENDEFNELLTKLAGDEINFTGALTVTEERKKTYFMTTPIALNMVQYFRIDGSLPLELIAESRPLRYAFMAGTTTIDLVTSKLKPGTYEIVLSTDIDEIYRMLKSGEVDAHFNVSKENAFDVYGDVISSDFTPLIFAYSLLMTRNPALAPIISVVQKALDNGALTFLAELHNTGKREYLKNKLFMRLSEEERTFMQDNPVIPFVVSPISYPVGFYNEREGQWQGFTLDVVYEIEAITGLSFKRVNGVNDLLLSMSKMLEDGTASMMTELMYTAERAEKFIWSKTVLMVDNPALISRSDYRNISLNEILDIKVGLIGTYAQTAMFREWFPYSHSIEYESSAAAFDALDKGEVDMVMSRTRDLLLLTNYAERTNFKANYIFGDPIDLAFAYNKDNAILCSIVDKALRLIDTNRIADQWINRNYDYRAKLVQARIPWLIGSSILFFLALAVVAVLFIRNRRARIQLALQAEEVLAASEAKSIFLATMSHEIRTPLNAIIGMTAIGKRTDDLDVKNYTLTKIDDASTHLLGVINDILDMSKIEANKLELSPVQFNFERMLQKVITVINFRVAEKRQRFFVNIDGKVPRLLVGDDQRLAQVITNLLSNAVKFTPVEGEICLTVSLVEKGSGVSELKIEVADSGIGISPEQQKKLFSAFGQAESGISREFGGTGLGLAISKRIVELMNGRIWLESEIGKGSRFIFTIKVPYGEENLRSQLAPGVQWDSVRVLAVDDLLLTRQYFDDIFFRLGIHCETVKDGPDACKIIEERGGFDIYFIDWYMPEMDGLALVKWIKSRGIRGKVVLISFNELEEIRAVALQSGADKCLVKPLLSAAIIDCLNECFEISGENRRHEPDNEFAGKRLLIVEDIEINREILLSLLEHTGLSIDCAVNGEEAVALIEGSPQKYNAVLMDMQMPVMDGLEATRRIRNFESKLAPPSFAAGETRMRKHIPIIAMTANVFKDDIERCLAAGMNDHIGKPINIEEMFEKLRKFLQPGL